MSDVPVWVGAGGAVGQAVTSAAQIYVSVRLARQKAAADFGRLLDELLQDLSAEELEELLGEDRVAELVGNAWEAASRTASDVKRQVLARIVEAVLRRGLDDAIIDPLPLLVRTVEAIDEPHVHLLALLASQRRTLRIWDIRNLWTGGDVSILEVILEALEGENLIENRAIDWSYDRRLSYPAYSISGYGRLFLRFVPDGVTPDVETAKAG